MLDWLYEKTGCILIPALAHGAVNAFAGVPTLFLYPAYADRLLAGLLMIGYISGLPLMAAAAVISAGKRKNTGSG